MAKISLPEPRLQIRFAHELKRFAAIYLRSALRETVADLSIPEVDAELAKFVSPHALGVLAQASLRGEVLFAIPLVLRKNPRLLAYYRLLLGYSQKEFYSAAGSAGTGVFKSMEQRGVISPGKDSYVDDLCHALCNAASALLTGLNPIRLDLDLFHELTILTYGPQLRGGANNRRGTDGISKVFETIRSVVEHSVVVSHDDHILLNNASNRLVRVQLAADPDVVIREELEPGKFRNSLAIEVKAGEDISNIHNRIGEAEKSHQKAKADGYNERWTVLNVPNLDVQKAKVESPSTTRFFFLHELLNTDSSEYREFASTVRVITGIAERKPVQQSKRKKAVT